MRPKRPFYFITYLLLILQTTSFAQVVTGVVLDENSTPLAGAHVFWKHTPQGTFTDETGGFSLALHPSQDTLIVQFIGYDLLVKVVAKDERNLQLILSPNATLFGEGFGVEVTGNRLYDNFSATQVSRLRAVQVQEAQAPTAADLLRETGQVFVQKSQQGGGSPVLRGMEANRILLMLDGMRLNNAIFRSGHLQQAVTVDQYLLEGAEVFFGANSLSYGSDALGGAVNFKTKTADWSAGNHASLLLKHSTALNEYTTHADITYGKGQLGALTSITYSNFGDAMSGKSANFFYPYFWKRDSLVQRIEGEDRIVANPNPYQQTPTGYQQWNLAQKVRWLPTANSSHELSLLYTSSSDIPRYDRLSQDSEGYFTNTDFRQAVWSYGPQERLSLAYTWEKEAGNKDTFWQLLRQKLFYMQMEESRITRRFGRTDERTQREEVRTWGAKFDGQTKQLWAKWQLGANIYYDQVGSTAYTEDIVTGVFSPAGTRYPDGGSDMLSGGFYLSGIQTWKDWQATAGLRYSWVYLKANFRDTTFFRFPFQQIEQRNGALTGSLNLSKKWKRWKTDMLVSTAFRSPNVDDAAKVFDSRAGETIILPNDELQPEYVYNAEWGLAYESSAWKIHGNVYYSWLRNLIQVSDRSFNGQDSLLIDGVLTKAQANMNTGRAYIYGGHIYAGFSPMQSYWSFSASMTYTYGQDISNQQPLGHIPPLYGQLELRHRWDSANIQQRFFLQYNGWKTWERLSKDDVDRPTFAVPNRGMPAWLTLNYRLTWQFASTWKLQLGIDNILDTHYRYFASGVNGLGRNVNITVSGVLK